VSKVKVLQTKLYADDGIIFLKWHHLFHFIKAV